MRWKFALGLASVLSGSAVVLAQKLPLPATVEDASATPVVVAPAPAEKRAGKRLPATLSAPNFFSAPSDPDMKVVDVKLVDVKDITDEPGKERVASLGAPSVACDDCAAEKLGPTLPEDTKVLQNLVRGGDCAPFRVYGWVDSGYTYSSAGQGLLPVQPRMNRFGNEYIFNQIALVLERPLKTDELSWGFNVTAFGGADPSLIAPRGGFDNSDPRWGFDFRQLYLSAHLPILTEGGVDVKAGRMTSVIGYESALAPYRPFYSNDYQWFYSQDGAFTGALATVHATKQLDVTGGITMGANTFFTLRGNGPCYLGKVDYWLQEDKRTMLTGSVYMGDNAIFAAPGRAGNFATVVELGIWQNWNKYLTQIVQSDNGWDRHVPGIGTGQWWSLYNIFVFHVNSKLDVTNRIEWFNDVNRTRIGAAATHYGEITLGLDVHPRPWIRIRPEIRNDFADAPSFGNNGAYRNQLTAAFDVLLQF